MRQVYVPAEHPRQRGERFGLPRDLHDDWCEPRGCGAGERVHTEGIKFLLSQSVYLTVKQTHSYLFKSRSLNLLLFAMYP